MVGMWQASLSSSYENVNLMLQYEAHISTFDKTNGSSPLHDACYSGSLRFAHSLSLSFVRCL
jgi:hypothetical protein